MPGLGAGHWGYILILLVIVLIIWGPGKLPDIGSGLGRGIREFRKATSETRDEFHKATQGDDNQAPPAAAAPAPGATGAVTPAPAAQPAPVGGGTPATPEHAAGEGDNTTAI